MCAIKGNAGSLYANWFVFKFIPCLRASLHNKRVSIAWEMVLGYNGVGEGEREGRAVDVSGISGYGFFKFLEKLDCIADEESKCAILVLVILVAIFHKEMCTHLDLLH